MYIDAHAHVDHYDDDELDGVMAKIDADRILTVCVSMTPASYRRVESIAAGSPWIIPAFGIHPWEAPKFVDDLDGFTRSIERAPMIGEIGLDHHFVRDRDAWPAQRAVFDFFLRTAREQEKIVNLHTKGAEQEALEMLAASGVERAIVHWYSGPVHLLREFIDMGAYLTVGVEVLGSKSIQHVAREIPDELLLTETDGPGAAGWISGRPGSPSDIAGVVAKLAEVRGSGAEELKAMICRNFRRLLGADAWFDPWREKIEA